MNKDIDNKDVIIIRKPKLPKFPKISKKHFRNIGVTLTLMVLLGASAGIGSYSTIQYMKNTGEYLNRTTQVYNVSDEQNVVNIASTVSKSVVSVSTKSTSYGWFGSKYVSEGAGTGIIISEDGYILTNNHVIDSIDSVSITLQDSTKYEAKLVKTDESKDLALLKVTTNKPLAAAKMGDSKKLEVGEAVIAIGNVLGRYSWSVSKGIVSGLGRPIFTSGSSLRGNLKELDDLIQTDTAINSGNSGGPLVNMKGEVIGINTAIDGTAQNIGFAVPIGHAEELVKSAK